MPRIVIDGRSTEVAAGTKVIRAAEELGIYIPRLCYHPALGSAGACRLCAVSFLEGPVKGLLMSCMVEAKEGMVVSTQHPDAVEFRRQVMEWLMMNHPHDCPVCDEGGHCVLQEMTVAGGHSIRRYPGAKRTYHDQDLGPLIQHEMNRCIHCWRCRRFYQDYSGYKDLGVMGLASRTYFGKAAEGPLESPFSGNLIDICPTGVFTDKPSRFKARRWECRRVPSVCIHCSLGCSTVVNARYREVLRIEAGQNPQVNGCFICDRGRYGFDFANHPQRPRQPLVEGRPSSWQEALGRAGGLLQETIARHGAHSVALVASARASLESLGALSLFSQTHGLPKPFLWMEREQLECARLVLEGQDLLLNMSQVQEADTVLALEVDPTQEAPMLGLALRQAWRRGGWVGVVDPRGVEMPHPFHHMALPHQEVPGLLECLSGKAPAGGAVGSRPRGFLEAWQKALERGKRPAIACGTMLGGAACLERGMELARLLRQEKGWGGLFPVLAGANSLGAAALLGSESRGLEDLLERIRGGGIKAMLLVETDPLFAFWGKAELKQAFQRLELLLVLDYLPSEAAELARILLPSMTPFETSCFFLNNEARLQEARAVHQGGFPIFQLLEEGHPPRVFWPEIPGGNSRAAWEALAGLSETLGKSMGFSDLQGLREILQERFPWLEKPSPGQRIVPLETVGEKSGGGLSRRISEQEVQGLSLALVQATFGTEELSYYSRPAREVEGVPLGFLHPQTAHSLGLKDLERVCLRWEEGELEFLLRTKETMSSDLLVIQAHWLLGWEKAGKPPKAIRPQQLGRKP